MFYSPGIHELKVKVISYLKERLSGHPLFKNTQIVYNHHPDLEREKTSILVTGSSADYIRLSPDNFLTTECGTVSLATVDVQPGKFIHWATKNCTEQLPAGVDPVDPGVYYLRVTEVCEQDREFTVAVKVLRRVDDEEVLFNYAGESQVLLEVAPMRGCSLSLRENHRRLEPDVDYTLDENTGVITFVPGKEPTLGTRILATYTYIDTSVTYGPEQVNFNTASLSLLPGVIVAFSDNPIVGDTMVVIVTEEREQVALVFGGRVGITLNFQTKAMDTPTAEKIADLVVTELQGPIKMRLELEDIPTSEIDISGESQDMEDATEGNPAYFFDLSANYETEWHYRVPLVKQLIDGFIVNFPRDVNPATATEDELVAAALEALLSTEFGPVISLPDPTEGGC